MCFFVLLMPRGVGAQDEAGQLAELTVELWPDYDRPAMLVLLTGTLPEDATLPATVVLPLPAGAELHAIARFDDTGALISDVESSDADGLLTLTTPGRRFRVEYYQPYEVDGDEHSFRFDWLSDLAVENMAVVVQQPLAATDIALTPPQTGSQTRNDGLSYLQIAPRPVAAGQPFTVDVVYTVEAPLLSAPSATAAPAATSATEPATTGGLNPLWLLAIPAGVALIVGAWFLGRQQSSGRTRKPRPTRTTKPAATMTKSDAARFCHKCGQPAQPGDVFCRKCGTQLK